MVSAESALVAIEIVEESLICFTGSSCLGWKKKSGNIATYGKTVENNCVSPDIKIEDGRKVLQHENSFATNLLYF